MSRAVYYFTDANELGGAERALLILIESIDKRAWQPTVLYHPSPGIAPLPLRARELGAAARPVPAMPLGLVGARRLPMFVRELRRDRPAVFHAHLSWPLAAKYALTAAVLARVPAVVATVHLFPDFRLDRSNYVQERLLARYVGRYLAVSHDIASQLDEKLRWPATKIDVVHNGIFLDQFVRPADPDLRLQLSGAPERPVFLSVARLHEQKGHDVLLRAAAQCPEASFVLAGEGPARSQLLAQAARLGLADRVRFLGHRPDVPDLLAASDALVLPSLYEGSSLAVLEAMAAGKPVVSSAIGGSDELVVDGETGMLVPAGDADALAIALRRLAAEPSLRVRLGAAGRERAERHFSASTSTDRVMRVYDDLLERAGFRGRA